MVKKYLPSSIFGKKMKVVKSEEDDMECIVKCLNCGKEAKYGEMRMVSGYVGCNNIIIDNTICFDDLCNRVLLAKKSQSSSYGTDDLYLEKDY